MIELFCGILSGGAFGPHIRHWGQHDVPANLVSSILYLSNTPFTV